MKTKRFISILLAVLMLLPLALPSSANAFDKYNPFEDPFPDMPLFLSVFVYYQRVDLFSYSMDNFDTVSAKSGDSVSIDTSKYLKEGFVYAAGYPYNRISTFSANQSTTFEVYYNRASYTVTYAYTGDVPEGANELLPAPQTFRYGQTIQLADDINIPGYAFSWSCQYSTMPAQNIVVTGSFEPVYEVELYYQNVERNGYDKITDTTTVIRMEGSGAYVEPSEFVKLGFTIDMDNPDNFITTYNLTSSTVFKIYYNRDSFTVTYAYNTPAPRNPAPLPASETYYFGQELNLEHEFEIEGYHFYGWNTSYRTMPAQNITVYANIAPDSTIYTIRTFYQKSNLDGYEQNEDIKSATTDSEVSADIDSYSQEGFELDYDISTPSGYVNGDATTILELYFKRSFYTLTYAYTGYVPEEAIDQLPSQEIHYFGESICTADHPFVPGYTFSGWECAYDTMPAQNITVTGSFTPNNDTEYSIDLFYQNTDLETYSGSGDVSHGTTGEDVSISFEAYSQEGFEPDYDKPNVLSDTIKGDGSTALKLYFKRSSYTLTYAYTGDVPEGANELLPSQETLYYQQEIFIPYEPELAGYTFSGWECDNDFMPAQNITVTGSFTPNDDTQYSIDLFYQNTDLDTYSGSGDVSHGTTGEMVSVDFDTYSQEGFEPDYDKPNVFSDTIKGDGSTTLKLYFKRSSYTLTYAYADGTPANAPALPEAQTFYYGQKIKLADNAELFGYQFNGWECAYETMPAQNITVTGSFTVKVCDKHDYKTISSDAATCTQDGEIVEKCIVCGHENTTKLPAVGHKDADNNKKCDVCNENLGIPVEECTCNCHKTNFILNIISKIQVLVWKLFRISDKQYCDFGAQHW